MPTPTHQPRKSFHDLCALVERCAFNGWTFRVVPTQDDHAYILQGEFLAFDAEEGAASLALQRQRTRKWLLSPYATDGEIVQTVFLAVVTALGHEARESFTYDGRAIFHPHHALDDLVATADRRVERVAPRTEALNV